MPISFRRIQRPLLHPLSRSKLFLAAATLLLTYGLVELTSYSGLFLLKTFRGIRYSPVDRLSDKQIKTIRDLVAGKSSYLIFSPTLGWTISPNGRHRLYRSNADGIRGDRTYSTRPPAGVLRIAAFGDSFTHNDDVGNEDTWQARMEEKSSNTEVLNFGVSGYGPGPGLSALSGRGLPVLSRHRPDRLHVRKCAAPREHLQTVLQSRDRHSPEQAEIRARKRFDCTSGQSTEHPRGLRAAGGQSGHCAARSRRKTTFSITGATTASRWTGPPR